ncbi:GTPase [Streptomyces sp. NPDC048717]|uniref:GTPase n=1 Tax=Streptomyces sp. NPDC048717 TaxID=3154928 RepID=UPI0034480B9F
MDAQVDGDQGAHPGTERGSGSAGDVGAGTPAGRVSGAVDGTAAEPAPEPPAEATGATSAPPATAPEATDPADPTGTPAAPDTPGSERSARRWDDGLIARRATDRTPTDRTPDSDSHASTAAGRSPHPDERAPAPSAPGRAAGSDTEDDAPPALGGGGYGGALRTRLDALHELVGLSRTRVESEVLAEAGRVLQEAAARQRLSSRHTVVAIAGATGSGKSTLFNALAGVPVAETGLRRPTTSAPLALCWSEGAAGLLDRLGIPGRQRRRPLAGGTGDSDLQGLVLIDLPDHDSAVTAHRDQVDRLLGLVDAVIWVVDPEKYADAALHERYLRPLAGHAEVTFVVLNQIDRLGTEAADLVLDDLRRLLDDDGMALGEHGEPGATVLSLSALTGAGVGELRELLGRFVQERTAPERRLAADVDAAAARLRPVYVADGRPGLGERARDEFADRLAGAVGARAAGEAAERVWRRTAIKACGTPWLRLYRWYESLRAHGITDPRLDSPVEDELTARQRVEQAVRAVSDEAARGLPGPWAQAVREAAARGAVGLPEALDELTVTMGDPAARPPRPAWWPAAVFAQVMMTLLQIFGALWLIGQIAGVLTPGLLVPALIMLAGIVGGPLVEWACAVAVRGPARRYGQEAERRLREAAAACGRARVLDPIAAELMRYREVREQYVTASGAERVASRGMGAGAGMGAGLGHGSLGGYDSHSGHGGRSGHNSHAGHGFGGVARGTRLGPTRAGAARSR